VLLIVLLIVLCWLLKEGVGLAVCAFALRLALRHAALGMLRPVKVSGALLPHVAGRENPPRAVAGALVGIGSLGSPRRVLVKALKVIGVRIDVALASVSHELREF
jgi:hypothetical protein